MAITCHRVCSAAADPLPLSRAEHIIYAAAFFNKEAAAAKLYSAIVSDYDALVATGATGATPIVAWVSYVASLFGFTYENGTAVSGAGYQISYATYKATLTADSGSVLLPQTRVAAAAAAAGPALVRAADSAERGVEIAFSEEALGGAAAAQAAVAPLLQDVDVLVDESFTPNTTVVRTACNMAAHVVRLQTMREVADVELLPCRSLGTSHITVRDLLGLLVQAEFLDTWGIAPADTSDYSFLAASALYRHDKAQTASGSDDWFGQAIIRPAVVLQVCSSACTPRSHSMHLQNAWPVTIAALPAHASSVHTQCTCAV